MKKELISRSSDMTKMLGCDLARQILKVRPRGGVVLGLVGELGSGKTTFVQGLAKGLGLEGRIISPTFILTRSYRLEGSTAFKIFHHIDLYRLEGDEIEVLNLEELWDDPGAIVVVEWADKIKRLLPKRATWLYFLPTAGDKRKISFEGGSTNALVH